MEESQGFRALLGLDEPKYSIEQIGAKVGKSPAFIAQRLKLTDLIPLAMECFYADEIGVGHALLLAKLPADQQQPALHACFKEMYNNGANPARVLLPVRSLQFWIDSNILLILKDAPFNKRDAQLVGAAGSCADCPKRTGHNKLLFGDDLGRQGDRCTDPTCYHAKVSAHVAKTVAAKPELVQISTAYGAQKESSSVLPRNRYTAIRNDKPKSKEDASRPEFKQCKYTVEAIITEGSGVGTIQRVCTNSSCTVHHSQAASDRKNSQRRAEQEKRKREQAIANTTGLRVLGAVSQAIPVRLMKRDLTFMLEKLVGLLDESRADMLARRHGIRREIHDGHSQKALSALIHRADESTLSRLMVETTILLSTAHPKGANALRDAANLYKVDTEAIARQVKRELAGKNKKKSEPTPKAESAA